MVDTLSLLYLPTALGLGALHALEPGHAKTLLAAYLIGTKGTTWDAFVLGASAAATHSMVVIALAVSALWLGKAVFTELASHWLQIASGIIVIGLGSWMLWLRWPRRKPAPHAHAHAAPAPVEIVSDLAAGTLRIVDTPDGERMRFAATQHLPGITMAIGIARPQGRSENLEMVPDAGCAGQWTSTAAPDEPHSFSATAVLTGPHRGDDLVPFAMAEPVGHAHEHHDHMDDAAHAQAHAASMPTYAEQGGRPSALQVNAFGAAGGMFACPASITVMLLALSGGQAAFGILAVLCFSLGLAVTMVGIGMVVVAGFSRISRAGRFSTLSIQAPFLSSRLVIATGLAALLLAH